MAYFHGDLIPLQTRKNNQYIFGKINILTENSCDIDKCIANL